MEVGELLFNRRKWSDVESGQIQALVNAVKGINEDQLLNASTDVLSDELVQRYSIEVPHLGEEPIVGQKEAKIDISSNQFRPIYDRSKPFWVTGTEVTLEISFEGEADVFGVCPSEATLNRPRGIIRDGGVVIAIQGETLTTEIVQNYFARTQAQIKMYLTNLRRDAAELDKRLRYQARAEIELRKRNLLANRNLVGSLGYKLKERNNPLTYPAANVRRKIKPSLSLPSATVYKPEPVLQDADYEHILSVIQHMSEVIERNPSTFSSIGEEAIRSHFLVQLNGHYEGSATGETFNGEGKTDILIREQGKNIFIAECKFWGGLKLMLETIDQLLGYTSWRDTKTAILIFCKNKDFTRTVQAIHDAVQDHPNFRRYERRVSETSHRYVFSQKNDAHREMVLTTLAFHIP